MKSLSAHAVRTLIIARKKLASQRVTLENQIRGLAIVFGVRLPRALTNAFVDRALKASEGVAGLSAAMRGLIAARTAVMSAVAAIDADMRRMTRASKACRRLMTIPSLTPQQLFAWRRQAGRGTEGAIGGPSFAPVVVETSRPASGSEGSTESKTPDATQLTPSSAGERAENAGIPRRRNRKEPPP
jgi:transposase-like protein